MNNSACSSRSRSNACNGQSTKYAHHMMTSQFSRISSRNRGSLVDVTSVTHTHTRTDRTNVKSIDDTVINMLCSTVGIGFRGYVWGGTGEGW